MKFQDYPIDEGIKQSLEELGFKRPTDIQHLAIRPILEGDDVMAIAQTGTGKTAAFVIPILDLMIELKEREEEQEVKCLVMVPTRELAIQINEVFQQLGRHTFVQTLAVTGGEDNLDEQVKRLRKGVDVLVATPGRMFDLIYQKHLKITKVRILVLDEADHMLDLGFNKDIQDVVKFLPKHRQTLFFSATISPRIKDLAYAFVNKPIRIQISPKDPVSKNVDHSVAFIGMDDKRFFLERLIKDKPDGKILVFVRTKVRAERVCAAMDRVGIKVVTLHGDKQQVDRLSVIREFKEGTVRVMVATDVSARGIDIQGVTFVVNYDLPEVAENYVHRVGRTGRGTSRGMAVSFCSDEEKPLLEAIEKFTTNKIKVLELNREEYQYTLDFTEDASSNWKSLLKEASEEFDFRGRKIRNLKKGKK